MNPYAAGKQTHAVRRVGVLFAAALIAGLMLTLALASEGQARPMIRTASCGATLNPSTGSAHAHWDVTCHNGEVTVAGYVKHDVGSGCAYVKAVFEGQITHKSGQSCGFFGGKTVHFSWTHPGSIADAYLTET